MRGVAIFLFILILVACAFANDVADDEIDEIEEIGGMERIVSQPIPDGDNWLGHWMQQVVKRLDEIESRVKHLEGAVGILYA